MHHQLLTLHQPNDTPNDAPLTSAFKAPSNCICFSMQLNALLTSAFNAHQNAPQIPDAK